MGLESFNPTPPQVPPQEKKLEKVVSEQSQTPEAKKGEPKTLERWVEKSLSDLMMRRIAGEDVNLIKDLPQAPKNLVEEHELRTGAEGEKSADEAIKLMRGALDHPSTDNFYSVWLESQGEDAKRTLRILLENPDRIRQAVKDYVTKSKTETEERLKREEIFKDPFERVADKLRKAQQTLQQEGLTEDASHIDEIIGKLEKTRPSGLNDRIELWNGESDPPNKTGWYPDERSKSIILEALGESYGRANAQFGSIDVEYYSDPIFKDRVKLEVREGRIMGKPGAFSRASLVFPSEWYKEKKQ